MASVPFFLHGAEYTVTPADSLQKAVQALRPGDTLTLLPGVYRQGTVAIRCRGTQESPIVIQGKDRENTLVTAWKSLDTVTWEPVPGKPFVYRAAWAEDTYGISDLANKRNMMPAPGADDMERFRGTYFYDRKEHYLYCHSFTGCKPGKGLRATVRSGYLFELNTAEHVVIRNLTFCGSAHETFSWKTVIFITTPAAWHLRQTASAAQRGTASSSATKRADTARRHNSFSEANPSIVLRKITLSPIRKSTVCASIPVQNTVPPEAISSSMQGSDFTTKPPVPRVWQSGMSYWDAVC